MTDEKNGVFPENELIQVTFSLYQNDLDWLATLTTLNPQAESKTEALRSAIATEVFLRKKIAEGAKIIVEEPDGSLRQILMTNRTE